MSAKLPRPKIGDIVECVFLDHCEDGSKSILFTVWGKLVKQTKTDYLIESWTYTNDSERTDSDDPNVKVWVIVRKAVKRLVKMVPSP